MHSVGIHSALAIKRQRKRRDDARRARERRFSVQSTESYMTSPRNSMGSLDRSGRGGSRRNRPPLNPETSIGMLHIGVVFLVLGAFLLVAGLLPGDLASWGGWFNELVMTGSFALFIGIFLLVLNRIISKQEDQDLTEYVQRQLTRSKSGHRLVRDVETGCLTTVRRMDERRSQPGSTHDLSNLEEGPMSPGLANSNPEIQVNSPPATGAVHLEKIVEECESKETLSRDEISISTTGSPTSPCETQELLRFYPPPGTAPGVYMIGAMPAVAVRHERRKQEKRNKQRPGQLTLVGRHTSPPSRGTSPTPSPLQSPPPNANHPSQCRRELPPEYYICGKVSILHLVVVSLLLGAILLIVGLVQLKPGADASEQKHLLMIAGSVLMAVGLVLSAVRCCRLAPCCRLHRVHERSSSVEEPPPSATKTTFPELPADSSREPLASAAAEHRVECVITHEGRKTSHDEISVENLRRDSSEFSVTRA